MGQYVPKVGDVVRLFDWQDWHAVVLGVFYDYGGIPVILRVHSAKNVFKKIGPEFIDMRLSPTEIHPATKEDFLSEIVSRQTELNATINELLGEINGN